MKVHGFTLIEVLVVIVVISVLMGVVVGSFGGVDREQNLRGYAEQLTNKIELARDRALQSNREWGLYIDTDEGVRFSQFDPVSGEWLEQFVRPFKADPMSKELDFTLKVDSFDIKKLEENSLFDDFDLDFGGGLDGESGTSAAGGNELAQQRRQNQDADRAERQTDSLPQIVLFSSGETTPFEIQFEPLDWQTEPWLIKSDGFSRTTAERLVR